MWHRPRRKSVDKSLRQAQKGLWKYSTNNSHRFQSETIWTYPGYLMKHDEYFDASCCLGASPRPSGFTESVFTFAKKRNPSPGWLFLRKIQSWIGTWCNSLICWFLSQGFAIIMSFLWGGLLILGAYFFVCKDRRSLLVKSLNTYHTGGEYPINAKWIHNRPLLLVWLIVGEVYRIYMWIMWGFTKHQGEWFHCYDPRGISICAVQERHGTGIRYWILSRRHEHATLTYNIGFLQYHSFKKKQHPKQLNVNLLNIFHRIHVWYICLHLVDFYGKLGGK